jgi:hypothetical protein
VILYNRFSAPRTEVIAVRDIEQRGSLAPVASSVLPHELVGSAIWWTR